MSDKVSEVRKKAIFERNRRKSSAIDESNGKVTMKNLEQDINFITDGYFDFNDGLWKSGEIVIRNVYIILRCSIRLSG